MKEIEVDGEKISLFVMPKSMTKGIVVRHHDLEGYFGVDRTFRIQQFYWFPRMKNYIRNHVEASLSCIRNKIPGGK